MPSREMVIEKGTSLATLKIYIACMMNTAFCLTFVFCWRINKASDYLVKLWAASIYIKTPPYIPILSLFCYCSLMYYCKKMNSSPFIFTCFLIFVLIKQMLVFSIHFTWKAKAIDWLGFGFTFSSCLLEVAEVYWTFVSFAVSKIFVGGLL